MSAAGSSEPGGGGDSSDGKMSRRNKSPADFARFTRLADFGYAFNARGQLRQLSADGQRLTERPFEFEAKPGNQAYNQGRYEALGDIITEEVYRLLEDDGGLQWLAVPPPPETEASTTPTQSFVFASPDYATATAGLLVLIHGSGVVRAGQWARRLIINEDLGE
jgi:hypothetical protein